MRFCQAFMLELWSLIGPNTDVPAGDIGVGGREIGFLYGMYKKLAKEHTGVLTGKGTNWGGSKMRPEATGYGNVYFAQEMLATKGDDFKGKTVAISGFGNVAWGAAKKVTELGAKVVTVSGPDGYIHDPKGLDADKIDYLLELRASNNDIVSPYADEFPEATFHPGKRPWEQKVDIAMPCATQNELNEVDAKQLVKNGCILVAEGANMPSTEEAIEVFQKNKLLYAPGKASNAGGVATSGLEMSQNSLRYSWSNEEVDVKLFNIMRAIHTSCVKYGTEEDGYVNYVKGANIAGFVKVADSMLELGVL
jgi:glutamate dehydrogenase (NADP+)